MRGLSVLLLFVVMAAVSSVAPRTGHAAVYSVENIAVDVTAKTAEAARELALQQGYRTAFDKLIQRLVPAGEATRVGTPNDRDLQGMIERFQVHDEKNSETRYLATLTVVFQPENVRNYLRAQRIRFSETESKPMLVLPVYGSAGTLRLWENPNPWREAWGVEALADGLITFVLPAGDMTDFSLISAGHASTGDDYRLTAIAERYQVDQVLITIAEESFDFKSGGAAIDVRTRLVSLQQGDVFNQSFSAASNPDEPAQDQFKVLARRIAVALEEDWKRRTLLDFSSRQRLVAQVPLSSLKHWLLVRETLSGVSMIEEVELDSLSIETATIELEFLGTAEQLKTALLQKNLRLREQNGFWVLEFSGA